MQWKIKKRNLYNGKPKSVMRASENQTGSFAKKVKKFLVLFTTYVGNAWYHKIKRCSRFFFTAKVWRLVPH
jgi:hypothetical protein